LLNGSDYTATNGTSIVLSVAAVVGDIVETVAISVNSFAQGPTGATGATGGAAITVNSTTISSGTSGFALYDKAGTVGETPQSALVTIYIANNFGGL
jgi:hypothetical protein